MVELDQRAPKAEQVYRRAKSVRQILQSLPFCCKLGLHTHLYVVLTDGQAEQWVAYAHMELQNSEFFQLEQIFNNALLSVPNVQLWSVYLDYIRRRNNLTTDADGSARRIINAAYEFALQKVGIDKDSANIWQDYVQFIRTGPGTVGGTNWQDQQKVDTLRKVYQRAICVPTQVVNILWKEYDQFEMGLNKMTVGPPGPSRRE
jgi:cleavage stimulation factor subunit 3